MQIDIIEINGITLAELVSDDIVIKEPQDALDVMDEAIKKLTVYHTN